MTVATVERITKLLIGRVITPDPRTPASVNVTPALDSWRAKGYAIEHRIQASGCYEGDPHGWVEQLWYAVRYEEL